MLTRRWRRVTLVTHIVAAGAWIGIDVIVAVLVLVGWFSNDVEVRSLAYRALAEFVVWPMLVVRAHQPGHRPGARPRHASGAWSGTGGSRSSSASTWCSAR